MSDAKRRGCWQGDPNAGGGILIETLSGFDAGAAFVIVNKFGCAHLIVYLWSRVLDP